VDGFVVTESAGEMLYLTDRERGSIHRTVLDAARGKLVYPCTWDPNPATAVALTEAAKDHGATAVTVPPPAWDRVDDRTTRAWFETLAGKGLPLLALHDPHHVPTPVSPRLYGELRQAGVLAGLLDASLDGYRIKRMAGGDPGRVLAMGDGVLVEAARMKPLGGFVSVIANIWPSFCLRLFRSSEHQLGPALMDRVNRVREAGGFRALKALGRMGARAPMLEPVDEALMGLAPAEGP
jgi:dihydrodipicolinate synthase/N-acetylneuraminate lyase